ncbi:MAG TPA: WYL domain-containing protein [Blastocatellia bacterium]|nr:WYL domain-containing protein [Blastocatellia bacterium]
MANRKTRKALPRRVQIQAHQRLRLICAEIQRRRYPNKAVLAQVIERDPRTVQRDLVELRNEFNAPLAFDRTKRGFYFTDPAWRLPPLTLTQGELLSFFIAERMLRRLSEATEVQLVRSALANLAVLLPAEVSVDLTALEQAISFAPEPVADVSPEILRRMTEAATERETLEIEYFSPYNNERTEREVNVLLVHNWIGEWYAICWDVKKRDYRDFHAGRISSIARTRRHFDPPEDWNAQNYLKKGFGMFRGGKDVTIEVEFDAFQARYARERKFHETEKQKQLKDGRLRLTFETTEAALEQVARWLMQYGEHVIALRPEKLREMMRERLQKTMKLYES